MAPGERRGMTLPEAAVGQARTAAPGEPEDCLGRATVRRLGGAVDQLESVVSTFVSAEPEQPPGQGQAVSPGLAGEIASQFNEVADLTQRIVVCRDQLGQARSIILGTA